MYIIQYKLILLYSYQEVKKEQMFREYKKFKDKRRKNYEKIIIVNMYRDVKYRGSFW